MKKNRVLQVVVVIALLAVVVGSFSGLFGNTRVTAPAKQEVKTVNVTNAVVAAAVSSTLSAGYSLIGSGVAPLTSSTQSDIIICGSKGRDAYMAAVEPVSETEFRKLADLHLPILDENRLPCGGDSGTASIKQRVVDIDNDGIKELIMNTGGGGASTDSFGIFKLDLGAKKIIHTSMKDPDGTITPTEMLSGSSVTHSDAFDFIDVDSDGKQELAVFNSFLMNQEAPKDLKSWDWHMEIYRWTGSLFEYDKSMTDAHPELLAQFQKDEIQKVK